MAYKPPVQSIVDNETSSLPSSEAVFEALKDKADVDLQNLSISGSNGDVLTLSSGVPAWSAPTGGASLPTQTGNSGKFLTTDGSNASWGSVTGFEPTLTKGNLTESTSSVLTITGGTGSVIGSGTSIEVKQASSTVSGFLSSSDWSSFSAKQESLVSGTNIKTVGGNSLLGSGDVGTIGVLYGGTGQTTANAAFNALAPSQASKADMVLSSDGTNTSWNYAGLGAGSFGTGNIVLGRSAPASITSTSNTILIGSNAGTLLNNYNTIAIGTNAFANLVAPGYGGSIAIGNGAGQYNVTTSNPNTFIGANSGAGVSGGTSTGSANTAVGLSTLSVMTTASNNSVLGHAAMQSATTANNCVAVGFGALNSLTTGSNCVAAGYSAARYNTGGSNTAIGHVALQGTSGQSTGGSNCAIGYAAGTAVTTASQSVMVGYGAATAVTTGGSTTAIGYNSLATHTTSQWNTAVGANSGQYASGNSNLFLGQGSGTGVSGQSSGSANTGVGVNTLLRFTTGGNNFIGGYNSGQYVTTGNSNTLIGVSASNVTTGGSASLTTGSFNTVLGANAGTLSASTNSGIAIGAYSAAGSNECAIGGVASTNSYPINTVLIGMGGASQTTSSSVKIMTMRASGTADTDMSSGSLVVAGSQGTGLGAGGSVFIATAPAAGSSGSSTNAHVNRLEVTASGETRLLGSTSGYVGMSSPAAPTSYSVVMPPNQGDVNSFLRNDGSGNLAWATSTFTAPTPLVETVVALSDAATIALDASLGNIFTVTLGGNRMLGNPTNPISGQKIIIRVKQDGSGGRVLSYDTAWNFGLDLFGISNTTTANAVDYIGAIYNSASSKWDVIAFVRGY